MSHKQDFGMPGAGVLHEAGPADTPQQKHFVFVGEERLTDVLECMLPGWCMKQALLMNPDSSKPCLAACVASEYSMSES